MKVLKALLSFLIFLLLLSSDTEDDFKSENIDYSQEMRAFVEKISSYGKSCNESFFVIPQNGQELLTENGESSGVPVLSYINAIDGVGREDLFFGYTGDNKKTPENALNYMIPYLELAENFQVEVLVIDYCSDIPFIEQSYVDNDSLKYVSFAADRRGLDQIPAYPLSPHNENNNDIHTLHDIKNFLYLINPGEYETKEQMLKDMSETNFDLIIIDLFDDHGEILSSEDIESLKVKKNGGRRLVAAYMSIGEAEDYRFYWNNQWEIDRPSWLDRENPNWKGNYKVKYWDPVWQQIILGNDNSYLDKILLRQFDGVYLDIIDAFEYYQNN